MEPHAANRCGRVTSSLHDALLAFHREEPGYHSSPQLRALLQLIRASSADEVNRSNCDRTPAIPLQLATLRHGRDVVAALLQQGADPLWRHTLEGDSDSDWDSDWEDVDTVNVAHSTASTAAAGAFINHKERGPLEAMLELGVSLEDYYAKACMENVLGGYGRLSPEGLVLLAKITPLKPTDAWPMMARVLEGDSEEARKYLAFLAPWLADDAVARGTARSLYAAACWPSVEGATLSIFIRRAAVLDATALGGLTTELSAFMAMHGCTRLLLEGALGPNTVELEVHDLEALRLWVGTVQKVAGSLLAGSTLVLSEPMSFAYPLIMHLPAAAELLQQPLPKEASMCGGVFAALHYVKPEALSSLYGAQAGWVGVLATCISRKIGFEVHGGKGVVSVYGSEAWPQERMLPHGTFGFSATVFGRQQPL